VSTFDDTLSFWLAPSRHLRAGLLQAVRQRVHAFVDQIEGLLHTAGLLLRVLLCILRGSLLLVVVVSARREPWPM
jgi:hypothetical protein